MLTSPRIKAASSQEYTDPSPTMTLMRKVEDSDTVEDRWEGVSARGRRLMCRIEEVRNGTGQKERSENDVRLWCLEGLRIGPFAGETVESRVG